MNAEFMKIQEMAKRVAEIKQRQAATVQAARNAERRIKAREQFIPKAVTPVRVFSTKF